uniref:Immunoglobulin subtype domain-containing protein n=1 Tax=Cyprinus carpio TaxID=7962 RepID=A0A8C2EW04_CYPCA
MQYSILSQAVTTQTVVKRKSNSCKAHKRRTQSLTRVSDSFNLEQTRFSLYRFTLNHRRGSTLQISLVILFQTPDLLKKMFHSFVFCSLCFWHLAVFCDAVQMISVMDGHSVTLQTNTEIQKEDLLMWKFGAEKSLIAEINAEAGSFNTYDVPDGRFRDRLELDKKTGSLTITNTTTEHAGLYLITISGKTVTEYRFNVTVYDDVFCCDSTEVVIRLALSALVGLATVVVLVYDIRPRRSRHHSNNREQREVQTNSRRTGVHAAFICQGPPRGHTSDM